MKQGSGNHVNSGQKQEPVAYVKSPGAVSEIGIQANRTEAHKTHNERGFMAPNNVGDTRHQSGSQGKYK
jgi:hypothetical protein